MLACLPYAWLWLRPRDLQDFSQSLGAIRIFASNFLFWRESGYFAEAAELKPLLHTWSLAVEEQYYLLFPLLLMLPWTLRRRWTRSEEHTTDLRSQMRSQYTVFSLKK